jgi:hypothetical protein
MIIGRAAVGNYRIGITAAVSGSTYRVWHA